MHQLFVIPERREFWQTVQCDIKFAGGSTDLEVPDPFQKPGLQVIRIHTFEEGAGQGHIGDHHVRVIFIAILSATPVTLPFLTMICSTPDPVLISPP